MRVNQKNILFVFIVLCAMLSFCPVNAESLPNYDLHLNIEQDSVANVVEPTIERERLYSLTLNIDSETSVSHEELPEFDSTLYLPKDINSKGYNPVITIDNSYSYNNEVSQDGSQKSNSFTFSDESGKWQFSGNYERKYFSQLENEKKLAANNNLRASFIEGSVPENFSSSAETADFKTSLASSYQLEVVYSFKPTVKGKVSFTQETIDDYDTGKSIQAEAIVETRSNVQIKAGVKNQLETNSVNSETNLGKENKVWTEFIIKF